MPWIDDHDLTDDQKADEAIKSIPDIKTLVKSYIDTKAHVGASIRIPSEEASVEDWNKFNAKIMSKTDTLIPKPDMTKDENVEMMLGLLGKPKDADGYDLNGIDVEDFEPPEELMADIRKTAMAVGLTKSQARKLAKDWMEAKSTSSKAGKDKLNLSRSELMKSWGLAFDDRNKDAVNILKKTGAPPELIKAAEAGEVDAGTLKWAYGLAASFGGEGTNLNGQGDNQQGRVTPGEAKTRITDMLNNREHAYWNSRDPAHGAAVKKMVEYQRATLAGG